MSKEQYPYPDDEFDALGARRVPQGVHREPTPRWRLWLPYLLVLVLVPLLTFGAVKYFAGGPGPDPTPTASDTPPQDEQGEQDATDGGEEEMDAGQTDPDATDTPDEAEPEDGGEETDAGDDGETEEPADLDYNTHILVLNGARIQGLAGQVSDALAADGWVNTEADDYTNASPTVTTLYYTSAEFESEAQETAQRLGIETVVEDAASASNGIVVVLRADFSLPDAP